MINLFAIPASDQSIYYLGQVFGFVGNILPVTNAPILLGVMFRALNTLVLAVAALIVVYVTVVGVVKTAAEGEFLGRQWSSIWVPLRMVLGIAALVPTPSGYSSIQIVMMWVVIQGIGAADLVWTTVIKYTQLMGSPLATVSVPTVGINSDMENLFQALVCQASAKASYPYTLEKGTNKGSYYCGIEGNQQSTFCQYQGNDLLNIAGPQTSRGVSGQVNKNQIKVDYYVRYPMGPNSYCGQMQYCDADKVCADTTSVDSQVACDACRAQVTNLQAIVTTFGAIAEQFVQADFEYRSFYDGNSNKPPPGWVQDFCSANNMAGPGRCCRPITFFNVPGVIKPPALAKCGLTDAYSSGDENNAGDESVDRIYWPYFIKPNVVGDIDFIQAAVDRYVASLNEAVVGSIQNQVDNTKITNDVLVEANRSGWIFAGAYYYYLAQQNAKNVDASLPFFNVNGVDPRSQPESVLYNTRNNYEAAGELLAQSGLSSQSKFTMSLPPKLKSLSKLSKGMNSSANSIMKAFMGMLTDNKSTNPLAKLAYLGKILLIVAQALFAYLIYVVLGLSIVGFLSVYALGTGFDNPIGPTITSFVLMIAPLFSVFVGVLFLFGALLAIYTPLIPYIIFTLGAVGWFILVIEAMVAAPLVALGILLPGGQSEILGKAEHALGYAFGIFLRPTLMIFGMMVAMLFAVVIVTMINAGFRGVMGQINGSPGLVEMLLFLGAYTGIVLAALNKCFSLIYVLPDRVLRWIGAPTEETGGGISEALGGTKGAVQQAAKGAQAQGAATAGVAQKGGAKIDEARKGLAKKEGDVQDIDIKETKPPPGGGGE